MAAIAMILGSVLGLLGAVFGWAFMDMSLLAALAVYVGTSIVAAMLGVMAALARNDAADTIGAGLAPAARG